jgi:hypothetical protein
VDFSNKESEKVNPENERSKDKAASPAQDKNEQQQHTANTEHTDKKHETAKKFAQNRDEISSTGGKDNVEQVKETQELEVSQDFKENVETMGQEEPTFDNSMDEYTTHDPPVSEPEISVAHEPVDN